MKKALAVFVLLGLASAVYYFNGPYVYPTALALGPCHKDWTSPTTYSERASPLRTLDFTVSGTKGRLCYGAPLTRGRRLFGSAGIIPDGRLWRMGANEPTRLFVDGPVRLGTVRLNPGRYSLYAVPNGEEWTISVSRSTWHWGNQITDEVRSQEVGSFTAEAIRRGEHKEGMVFTFEDGDLVLSWGFTRVRMPIVAAR